MQMGKVVGNTINPSKNLYVGVYSESQEVGIHKFQINPVTPTVLTESNGAAALNPSYLTITPQTGRMYVVLETMTYEEQPGGAVAAFDLDSAEPKLLGIRHTRGTLPCHLLVDEQRGYIFTANYMSGSISMFCLNTDGSIGELCDYIQHEGRGQDDSRQEGPHVHYIGIASDDLGIWCVDLGLDQIKYYEVDDVHSRLIAKKEKDLVLPAGSGPRHFVMDKKRSNIMYIVCELTSEVIVVSCEKEGGLILQRISTLPPEAPPSTCAAIRLSADSRFLYVSNRGHDSIAVFKLHVINRKLELVEIVKTVGKNPRDFTFWKTSLFIANQFSNEIRTFDVDLESGRIRDSGYSVQCHEPVCLVVV